MVSESKNCIGLFGTCGSSTWRINFISQYEKLGYEYYNPQVEFWDPSLAEIEADHLATDNIILFPITDETYAVGSLSEVGFSLLSAIKLDDRRDIVVMITQNLTEDLMVDADRAKESLRARALVYQHLKVQNLPNVYLVDSLKEMLDVSKVLYASNLLKQDISKFSIKNRR